MDRMHKGNSVNSRGEIFTKGEEMLRSLKLGKPRIKKLHKEERKEKKIDSGE
jgi:hypothetical protein